MPKDLQIRAVAKKRKFRWKALHRKLSNEESGTTAVEFGLLALPFFAIVGAILETGIVFLSSAVFDSAIDRSTRLVLTGQAQVNNLTGEDFRQVICSNLLGLFDCSKMVISVTTHSDFGSATLTPPIDLTDGTWLLADSYTPGGGSEIVLVEAHYKWPTILDIHSFNLSNSGDGHRLMSAVRVFRNEPF